MNLNFFKAATNKQLWIKRVMVFFAVLVFGLILLNGPYLVVVSRYWLGGHSKIFNMSRDDFVGKNDFGQPNFLQIESLKIEAPVLFASTTSETEFQSLLKNGVVHYPETALAGQFGNVYIFGHSSDFIMSKGNFKQIFALLPEIKTGAEIKLSDSSGKIFVYKVISTKVVAPDDVSVLSQGDGKKKLLTVQTSYPVGTALERFVAIAQLQE